MLLHGLIVDQVTLDADRVMVAAHVRAATAACPLCGRASRRVHSRYNRRLGDLPWQGRVGELRLQVRRFRCPIEQPFRNADERSEQRLPADWSICFTAPENLQGRHNT